MFVSRKNYKTKIVTNKPLSWNRFETLIYLSFDAEGEKMYCIFNIFFDSTEENKNAVQIYFPF